MTFVQINCNFLFARLLLCCMNDFDVIIPFPARPTPCKSAIKLRPPDLLLKETFLTHLSP